MKLFLEKRLGDGTWAAVKRFGSVPSSSLDIGACVHAVPRHMMERCMADDHRFNGFLWTGTDSASRVRADIGIGLPADASPLVREEFHSDGHSGGIGYWLCARDFAFAFVSIVGTDAERAAYSAAAGVRGSRRAAALAISAIFGVDIGNADPYVDYRFVFWFD